MGYYRGDFYRGSRGDPGFFSFLGKVAKSALGFVPGVGPILSKVADVAVPAISKIGGSAIVKRSAGIIKAHPVLTGAGAAGLAGLAGAAAAHHGSMAGAGMGAMNGAGGGFGRKRRRMNVYNPRALRRALRRAKGFAHMARQIIRVQTHYKHPKKFRIGHFKKKSKR
jgi:hypothetical protein